MNMNKLFSYILRMKWVIIVILIIGGIIYGGNRLLGGSTTSTTERSEVTTKVVRGNLDSVVSASGTIKTANYLAVTTSVNGIIKTVYVKEGGVVKKGQKIMDVTLDSEGEQSQTNAYAAYQKAKQAVSDANNRLYSLDSDLRQKEEDFQNVKEHNSYQTEEDKLAYKLAENAYLTSKYNNDSQNATIQQLQTSLNNAWLNYQSSSPTVTAPADGVIANIIAVEGTQVQNSVSEKSVQTVASIKQEGTPITSLNVSEIDINSIKVGQKVKLTLDSLPDNTFTGIVVGIDKIGTTSSGVSNYPVIVKFDEDSSRILPNMGVNADIILDERTDVLYVPSAAITKNRDGTATVQVVTDSGIHSQSVETGLVAGTNTEITSGLGEGDTILMSTLPTTGFTETTTSSGPAGGIGIGGIGR